MSKTVEAVGMIVGGLTLAILSGPIGIIALQGSMAAFHAMLGIGLTTALAGVGVALRPTTKSVGTDNSINISTGVASRRVIYGRFQTAGVLTYAGFPPSQNVSTSSQYLHLVYTLCAHEISSFDAVVIDGVPYNFGTDILPDSALPSTPWQVHPAANGVYNDFYWQHMMFEFDFGVQGNPNQPFPNLANADSSWTSACLQQGCAKVHVILRADTGLTQLYAGGNIPNLQFLVTGKKVIDTRVATAWVQGNYAQYQWIVDNSGLIWVQMTAGTPATGGVRPSFEGNGIGTVLSDGSCSWRACFSFATAFAGNTNPPSAAVGGCLLNEGWNASAALSQYTIIEAPLGLFQMLTTAGTTGSTRPNFSKTRGVTTSDGTGVWTCLGRSPHAINPSNSALIVNDYLQDPDAGMGTPASSIDLSSVSGAANVCEEAVLIVHNADNSLVYENLYSCNGMFDHSSTRGNVLSALLASMAGWAIPPGDQWRIFAGAYNTPTLSFTDNDLRAGLKGDFRLSKRDVANSIQGTYTPAYLPTNPGAKLSSTQVPGIWQSQSFPPYQANGGAKPDYLNAEDGGQVIWQDVHFEFTTSLWMAQRLAKITLMRLRYQETLTLQLKLTAFPLEAGDTFFFTHPHWGIAGAVFEATQVSLVIDMSGKDPVLGVDVIARHVNPAIYSFQGPTSSTDYGEYSAYGLTGQMTGVE